MQPQARPEGMLQGYPSRCLSRSSGMVIELPYGGIICSSLGRSFFLVAQLAETNWVSAPDRRIGLLL